ncbi:33 kDa ribonucleo, chloroplastic [Olea europaea subsp. europaea]|uniref:33 kDa ribonucleo, chloroplastic n=1 Tax=Olea europaea subsp. europaea TaxID=158383 RepID=A0A8S0TPE9_OLEEU|nr:33 kDa ribonucleo, chloroplastic [Olea europaea subsp. europaea]
MSASSVTLSVAATATTISNPSNSIHHFSLTATHFFPFKSKPIKSPNLKSHYNLNSPPFSHSVLFCASAAFDSIEITQEETQEIVPEQEVVEKGEDDEGVESQSAEAGRLYVGNLPFSMTSSQLSEIFAEAGRIVSVEIVYDRVTDRSRGFAFVTMGSAEEAKEAIRLFDGSQIGGRTAKVNFPEVPRGGEREVMAPKIRSSYQGFVDSPHKIYAGNLSWNLTSQGLREAFADQPGFLSAKVIYDRDSGRSRGFGFISFASAEEVESALNAMNGVELEGRPLRLNLAEQRTPVSPPEAIRSISDNDLENSEILSSFSP